MSLSRIIHHSHSFTRLEVCHHIYFISLLLLLRKSILVYFCIFTETRRYTTVAESWSGFVRVTYTFPVYSETSTDVRLGWSEQNALHGACLFSVLSGTMVSKKNVTHCNIRYAENSRSRSVS